MAAEYGFVYVLRNECMPGIYKIGMTSRAPSQRCDELSAATSAPIPFEIVCFGEVRDPAWVESTMHDSFSEYRVSEGREFFALPGDEMPRLFGLLREQSIIVGFGELSFLYGGCRRELIEKAASNAALTNPGDPSSDLGHRLADRFMKGEC